MTREEAKRRIECCRDFLANNYSDMGEPNFTAFNMAIEALSAPKGRLIDADALLNETVKKNSVWNSISNASGETLEQIVNRLQSEPCEDKLEQIRAEIQENINYNKNMNYQGIVAGLLLALDIIDKFIGKENDNDI